MNDILLESYDMTLDEAIEYINECDTLDDAAEFYLSLSESDQEMIGLDEGLRRFVRKKMAVRTAVKLAKAESKKDVYAARKKVKSDKKALKEVNKALDNLGSSDEDDKRKVELVKRKDELTNMLYGKEDKNGKREGGSKDALADAKAARKHNSDVAKQQAKLSFLNKELGTNVHYGDDETAPKHKGDSAKGTYQHTEVTKESVYLSDYQLYQILESNGYEPDEENLEILKEGIESGRFSLIED